jgi:chemotaxis signal transduction protein
MTLERQTAELQMETLAPRKSGLALRVELAGGLFSIPLKRVHHVAAYASLTPDPAGGSDDYFLGWLMLRGDWVPVFDLNRIVCDQPTPEHFGSRIIVLRTGDGGAPTLYIGLAGGVTDTLSPEESKAVEALNLDSYLPMLYTMIRPGPADV